jgi:hypothetical protein
MGTLPGNLRERCAQPMMFPQAAQILDLARAPLRPHQPQEVAAVHSGPSRKVRNHRQQLKKAAAFKERPIPDR